MSRYGQIINCMGKNHEQLIELLEKKEVFDCPLISKLKCILHYKIGSQVMHLVFNIYYRFREDGLSKINYYD